MGARLRHCSDGGQWAEIRNYSIKCNLISQRIAKLFAILTVVDYGMIQP